MSIFHFNRGPAPGEILDMELARMDNWLDAVPGVAPGELELTDAEVSAYIPLVSRGIAEILRELRDGAMEGPVLVMGDTECVPPDLFSGGDPKAFGQIAEECVKRWEQEDKLAAETGDYNSVGLGSAAREMLETGGPAAQALLETLDRGLDATTPEMTEVHRQRLIAAGLPVWLLDGSSGWLDYPPR